MRDYMEIVRPVAELTFVRMHSSVEDVKDLRLHPNKYNYCVSHSRSDWTSFHGTTIGTWTEWPSRTGILFEKRFLWAHAIISIMACYNRWMLNRGSSFIRISGDDFYNKIQASTCTLMEVLHVDDLLIACNDKDTIENENLDVNEFWNEGPWRVAHGTWGQDICESINRPFEALPVKVRKKNDQAFRSVVSKRAEHLPGDNAHLMQGANPCIEQYRVVIGESCT